MSSVRLIIGAGAIFERTKRRRMQPRRRARRARLSASDLRSMSAPPVFHTRFADGWAPRRAWWIAGQKGCAVSVSIGRGATWMICLYTRAAWADRHRRRPEFFIVRAVARANGWPGVFGVALGIYRLARRVGVAQAAAAFEMRPNGPRQ